jgi:3'-phosphoadenosine 5'-phosphosulfate sulfotransferase (PAPS reductase)/FAD synthetase
MNNLKHVVGFSGGADSQACALWVRQRYPAEDIILLNTLAGGNEHPMTEEFIRWYSEHIFPVTVITPLIRDLLGRGTRPGQSRDRRQEFADDDTLTFDRLAYIKGRFPSRKAQFCTEHLKLVPQLRWCREMLHPQGLDYERYTGVRCDESAPRANTPEREWDPYFDCYLNHPIRLWTKREVFAFLKDHGEQWNGLYEMGFGRVGCAPCINSGKEDINNWATRFPAMIDKVRQWEQSVGRTFFAPCVPGKAINWVDEVVDWARTDYGGRQVLLPMLEVEVALGSCSSKYGLCE